MGHYIVYGEFITNLRFDNAELTSLTLHNCSTLEHFETYNCAGDISSIDLSSAENLEKLDIDFNDTQITSIDLTHNTSLKNINVNVNTMTDLTLPDASDEIETLYLSNAGNLTELNASGHTGLRTLSLSSMNALTSLTLNGCTSLSGLTLYDASNLETLDITNCTSLKKFYLSGENLVASLDFSGCEFLDDVMISGNSTITGITIPDARDLSRLKIESLSALTSLELSGSTIDCLEIFGCSSLTSLNVAEGNRLKKVSLKINSSLKFLNTDLNAASTLEELRIESCSQLSDGSIPRDSIDLSGYSALKLVSIIDCWNYIYGASFEGCTSLTDLRLQSNHQIENLNISECTSLRTMDLYDNNLDSAALTSAIACGIIENSRRTHEPSMRIPYNRGGCIGIRSHVPVRSHLGRNDPYAFCRSRRQKDPRRRLAQAGAQPQPAHPQRRKRGAEHSRPYELGGGPSVSGRKGDMDTEAHTTAGGHRPAPAAPPRPCDRPALGGIDPAIRRPRARRHPLWCGGQALDIRCAGPRRA